MLQDILNHEATRRLIKEVFQEKEIEVLKRPHSFVVRCKEEPKYLVSRIIILPPYGYTGNKPDELNSHDEVRRAKITIKGILRNDKHNFSLVKNCLRFSYLIKREVTTEGTVPYALVSDNEHIYREKLFSCKETFYVVKENGEGFYHNLINVTDEPLVLLLEKELRSGKQMDIEKKSDELKLSISERKLIFELIIKIKERGDELFNKDVDLIEQIIAMEKDHLLPILIEGLNIYETGRHEPCTVYALILKKSKYDKAATLKYLKNAIKNEDAPLYYLKELISKIDTD